VNLKLSSVSDPTAALAVSELVERAVLETTRAFREEAEPRPGAVRRLLEEHLGRAESLLLLAHATEPSAPNGGDPAALLLAIPFTDPVEGSVAPLVAGLWVHPSLRHRGLARALVAEAVRVFAERGVAGLHVRAAHNDDALISMGERWGFVRAWELMVRE